MSAARMDQVKRRLLKQAVDDNIATIRGLPPRNVRPAHRFFRLWIRRTPLLLIFLMLAGSTYLASDPTPARDTIAPAKIIVTRGPRHTATAPTSLDATPLDSSAL